MTLGVGFVGAGAVVQAIHLPAIATLPTQLRVRHVVDASAAVAASVGDRTGARHGTDPSALLDDPAVDIVVVATPDALHPRVAIDACRAGKRAVLVEKPLALTPGEADAVAAASRVTGVPVQVGTMHAYDPAFRRAQPLLPDADAVTFETVFGPNPAFVDDAVELVTGPLDAPDPIAPMAMLGAPFLVGGLDAGREWLFGTLFLLGLGCHDLAVLRVAHGEASVVRHASVLGARGYHVVLGYDSGLTATLTAYESRTKHTRWAARWLSADRIVDVTFPTSWGSSESSVLEVREPFDGTCRTTRWDSVHETGYREEWRQLVAVAHGDAAPLCSAEAAAADVALVERIVRVGNGRPEHPDPADASGAGCGRGVALLGAGWAAAVHGPIASGLGARVRVVASRTERSAERLAWAHRARVGTFDDLERVVGDPEVDVVVVAGPPATHAGHAVAALRADKVVLIEKPLATTLADADALVAAASTSDRHAGYLENWAFAPVVSESVAQVRAGRMGAVERIAIRCLHGPPAYGSFLDDSWGGGCLFDLGAHPIWWALALLGDDDAVRDVTADIADDDTRGTAVLHSRHGIAVTVEASWQQPAGDAQVVDATVHGSTGVLVAALEPRARVAVDGAALALTRDRRIGGWARKNGYAQQLTTFLGPRPEGGPSIRAGRDVLEVICAAYASAGRAGEPVALPFTGPRDRTPRQLRGR